MMATDRKLTHVDARGRIRMVDVGHKAVTAREAVAGATVSMSATARRLIKRGGVKKGDPIETARLAGIMAAKRTSDLIPLCHPLALTHVGVEITPTRGGYAIQARARTSAQTGVEMEALTAVAVAFFLNTSSYYGEIYRAGIESVGRGQWDAARSTGLSAFQTLGSVVLPQAIRNVLPDLVSNTVEVVKLTSIASVVALPEMLYSADMARSVTFNASPIVLAAAIYLVMLWPVVRLISRLERRMAS